MTTQIKPLKKLGQNFLQNEYYAERIVESLNCKENDVILEIGAGKGVLTKFLLKEKYKKLSVIEIDQRLVKLLKEKFSPDLTIIQNSILNVSIEQIAEGGQVKIIGNIPYNITSEIIFKIVDNFKYVKRAILMIQREVANRLIADTKTKDYGILTVLIGFHCRVQRLFDVNRDDFYPIPNVDSSVICLDFDVFQSPATDFRLFKKIVKTSFNFRRKMLRNSLKNLLNLSDMNAISSISLDKRPEELSIEDFVKLTNEISSKLVQTS
jgi:16S rRNA (adenine1518-N6/adenine1519-N6)-dimethyltransferase